MYRKSITIIVIPLIVVSIASCTSTLDRKDPNSILKQGAEYFVSRNYDSLLTLVKSEKGSSLLEEMKLKALGTTPNKIEAVLKNANEIELLKSSIKKNAQTFSTGILRTESAEYFFLIDNEYYNLSCQLKKSENGEYEFEELVLTNLSKECSSTELLPQTNISINRESSYWLLSNPMTFKQYSLKLKNISNTDFKSFKYRMILRDINGKEFFNRVIYYQEDILVDEIVDVRVDLLNDFIAGFPINNESFSTDFEVVSVTTKSKTKSCELIESLK